MRFTLPFGLTPRRKVQEGPRYGDIHARAVASAIDLFLLFLLLAGLFQYLTHVMLKDTDTAVFAEIEASRSFVHILRLLANSEVGSMMLANFLLQTSILGLVLVLVQVYFGTTPGKWLLGLKIVRAGTLEPVEKWRYPLRILGYVVALAPAMLGILWASFNRQRRGWHDYLAGTVVIYTRPEGWYWEQFKKGLRWVWKYAASSRGGR